MELQVVDNQDKSRFEVRVAGQNAGFLDYRLEESQIAFLHTETEEKFRGRGIAGHLVRASLDSARARGLAVLPYCPYVHRWIDEHPEYTELVPADRRAGFGMGAE
jgi:uncharacterized protein